MKKYLLFFVIGLAAITTASFAQTRTWQKLSGPQAAYVIKFAVHPNGTYYLAAYTDWQRNLLRSTDNGTTWETLLNMPPDFQAAPYYSDLYDFGFGADGKIVMRVLHNLYVSSDEGNSWSLIRDSVVTFLGCGKPDEYFVQLLESPSPTYYKLRRTTDGGKTWIDASRLISKDIVDWYGNFYWAGNDTYLYCNAVYNFSGYVTATISYDNGATWNNLPHADQLKKGVGQVIRLESGKYLVQSGLEVFIGDLQNSWQKIADLPGASSNSIQTQFGPITVFDHDRIAVMGTNNIQYSPLFISERGTTTMKRLAVPSIGDRNYATAALQLKGDKSGGIVWCTFDGIFRSIDDGETWAAAAPANDFVSDVQIDHVGRIFTKARGEYPTQEYSNYLGFSRNQGATWSRTSPIDQRTVGYLGPAFDGGVITTVHDSNCTYGMDIWYYGGIEIERWTKLSRTVYAPPGSVGGGGSPIANFTLVDSADNVLLSEWWIYKTEDRGKNWDRLPSQPINGTVGTFSPSWDLYIGDWNQIAMTMDEGITWKTFKHLPYPPDGWMQAIIAPTDQILFVGVDHYGVYRSEDGGTSWAKVVGPWGDSLRSLAYTSSDEIFIGSSTRGLFSCDLNGNNAKKEPLITNGNNISSLFVYKGKDVYVGTWGSSLWVSYGSSSGVASEPARDHDYQAEIVSSNTSVAISLRITSTQHNTFDIALYDALGKILRTIPSKTFVEGHYIIPFDTHDLSAGAYFIKIQTDKGVQTLKFTK